MGGGRFHRENEAVAVKQYNVAAAGEHTKRPICYVDVGIDGYLLYYSKCSLFSPSLSA